MPSANSKGARDTDRWKPGRATILSIADCASPPTLLSISYSDDTTEITQTDMPGFGEESSATRSLRTTSYKRFANVAHVAKAEVVTFQKCWLIRIGAGLVLSTASLLVLLSILAFGSHFPGAFAAIALYSYLAGSFGMILLCIGAVLVLMRRRPVD